MRSFLAFLLGLLALVCTAVAVPTLWTERNLVDETGYVALAEPLGRDPAFKKILAQTVTESVVDDSGLSAKTRAAVRPVVLQGARSVVELDRFPAAWAESNRRTHQFWFGEPGRTPTRTDRLVVDVSPLAALVADQLPAGVRSTVKVPRQALVVVGGSEERRAIQRLEVLDPWSYWIGAGAVLFAVGAVLLARRRSAAALWLGIGTLVVAAVLKGAAVLGAPILAERASSASRLGARLEDALRETAEASFDRWLLVVAAIGLVLAVVGAVGRLVSARRERAPAG